MPRTGKSAEEIRERAVASAVERMRRHGFEKVRLVDIAKDVGVSHAALYAHFSDKAALLDTVSERWLASLDEKLEALCAGPKPPREKIETYFLTVHAAKVEKVRRDPELYRAFDAAAEGGKPFIERHVNNLWRHVTTLAKEAQAAGHLRKASAEKAAELFLEATASFTHPKMVALHLEENRKPLLKKLIAALWDGLA